MGDIREKIVKNWRQRMFQGGEVLFKSSLTSKRLPKGLRDNISDFLFMEEWPPSRLDFDLMDFCVLSDLETNTCANASWSVDGPKQSLLPEWYKILTKTLCCSGCSTNKQTSSCCEKIGRSYWIKFWAIFVQIFETFLKFQVYYLVCVSCLYFFASGLLCHLV